MTGTETSQEKKVSRSETGYAKNAAAMASLVSTVKSMAGYDPSVAAIDVAHLEKLNTDVGDAMRTVNDSRAAYHEAVNVRRDRFDTVDDLATRITNAYTLVATERDVADAQGILRKIRGSRKRNAGEVPADPATKAHSTSQRSFDSLQASFEELSALVRKKSDYAPKEKHLSADGIIGYLGELSASNDAVEKTTLTLDKARARRNALFGKNGVGGAVAMVKKYVRSAFGPKSQEYRSVAGIKVTKV